MKREQDECTDIINIRRAYISSISFSVVLPILGICFGLVIWNSNLKAMFISLVCILEVFQLLMVCLFRMLLGKGKESRHERVYVFYFAVTIIFMLLISCCDVKVFGSEILYVLTCIYLVFVPVLKEKIRVIFLVSQTAIVIAMMFVFDMDARITVDVCIMQLCMVIISKYEHEMLLRRKKITSRLRKKTSNSEHDALTGLTNRRGLERRVLAMWPCCEKNKVTVGMIAIDIDYFKKYNDTFGHLQGDTCLKMVADALKESAERSTDIVTRTGGEEFLIFVQNINPDELPKLALKVRKNVEKKAIPHAYCVVSKNVTVSMGVASCVPNADMNFKKLYEEADKALYEAKKNGRNCIVYEGNLYGRIRNGAAQAIGR